MKKFNLLFVLTPFILLLTGCPVGTDYPLSTPGTEKIDKALIGTWIAQDPESSVKKVKIKKSDKYSYNVMVVDTGSYYWVDDMKFTGYTTEMEGKKFVYFKGETSGKYYLYCYEVIDKKQFKTWDVGLKEGGIDAVVSTDAFRQEVIASLKHDDCLSGEILWIKE